MRTNVGQNESVQDDQRYRSLEGAERRFQNCTSCDSYNSEDNVSLNKADARVTKLRKDTEQKQYKVEISFWVSEQ